MFLSVTKTSIGKSNAVPMFPVWLSPPLIMTLSGAKGINETFVDEFKEMPYETIKRMFSGTAGPDLEPLFNDRLVELQTDGSWKIPFILANTSSAAAKDTEVSVTINNPTFCEKISTETFIDQSKINPGKRIFMVNLNRPVHRG
ncbi:hypothetical protein IID10_10235, partial [candidate division KSB1 bacterium]|nr:hypothetical protein [candidate division KSB1 bacterium]